MTVLADKPPLCSITKWLFQKGHLHFKRQHRRSDSSVLFSSSPNIKSGQINLSVLTLRVGTSLQRLRRDFLFSLFFSCRYVKQPSVLKHCEYSRCLKGTTMDTSDCKQHTFLKANLQREQLSVHMCPLYSLGLCFWCLFLEQSTESLQGDNFFIFCEHVWCDASFWVTTISQEIKGQNVLLQIESCFLEETSLMEVLEFLKDILCSGNILMCPNVVCATDNLCHVVWCLSDCVIVFLYPKRCYRYTISNRTRETERKRWMLLLIWQPVNSNLLFPNTVWSITDHVLQQSSKYLKQPDLLQ